MIEMTEIELFAATLDGAIACGIARTLYTRLIITAELHAEIVGDTEAVLGRFQWDAVPDAVLRIEDSDERHAARKHANADQSARIVRLIEHAAESARHDLDRNYAAPDGLKAHAMHAATMHAAARRSHRTPTALHRARMEAMLAMHVMKFGVLAYNRLSERDGREGIDERAMTLAVEAHSRAVLAERNGTE